MKVISMLMACALAGPVVAAQPELTGTGAAAEGDAPFVVETVVENVEIPWAIVFASDGRMFFTERPGRVRLFEKGVLEKEPVYTVPEVKIGRGEIGLMGMCLHPQFEANHLAYIAYAHTDGDVRVERFELVGRAFTAPTEILKGVPASINHAGCRIAFGPDGKLYITTGERFEKELAQDMSSLGGKTLRVSDDGSIPADNPFVGVTGARPEIWTFGHRNAQGMDWQPGTGLMFQTEHGPSGEPGIGRDGDELNIVERGKNYGWPRIHHGQTKEGMETPIREWTPAIAPASGMFYTGAAFPEFRGNYLVGALGGLGRERRPGIYRLVIDGRQVVKEEVLAKEFGRIREVVQGPEGAIYFSTSNRDGRSTRAMHTPKDDRILRLVPKSGGK